MPKPGPSKLSSSLIHALCFLPKSFPHFGFSYSPTYKTFITHNINRDDHHPLNEIRKRIIGERKKNGLWWHVTVDKTASLKRVVRTWVRRRLTNAFVEALKERGITEEGKLLPAEGKDYKRPSALQELEKRGEDITLAGSLKLHAEKAVVAAKYVDLKKETDVIVDGLLKGLDWEMQEKLGWAKSTRQQARPSQNGPQRHARSQVAARPVPISKTAQRDPPSKDTYRRIPAPEQASQRGMKFPKQAPQWRGPGRSEQDGLKEAPQTQPSKQGLQRVKKPSTQVPQRELSTPKPTPSRDTQAPKQTVSKVKFPSILAGVKTSQKADQYSLPAIVAPYGDRRPVPSAPVQESRPAKEVPRRIDNARTRP